MLKDLRQFPTNHIQVQGMVEALLRDTTLCLVALPERYGEIRWLAAHALAAERAKAGIGEPVRMSAVAHPLTVNELGLLAHRIGLNLPSTGDPTCNFINKFAALRDRGEVPLYDIEVGERNGFVGVQTWRQINPEVTIPESFSQELERRGAELVTS